MRSSSLQDKTIRPGLMNYSFYASNRMPASRAPARRPMPKLSATRYHIWPVVVTLAIVGGLVLGIKSVNISAGGGSVPQIKASSAAATVAASLNHCAGNSLSQLIKVSISDQHLWACQGSKVVYDTPVVTGMEAYAADKTPIGSYQISAKQTDATLTGSDTTGNWSDPVHYWMPFLDNQYGTYGLHDATWRPDTAFGKISPTSNQASHGCVELPLGASAWLYNWAQVGTTVTIQS